MAFRDENGKITIDDEAAAIDIKNLNAAAACYDTVISMVQQMETMTSDFKGRSQPALADCYLVYKTRLNALKKEASETADMIKRVVEKYHEIDRNLKEKINQQSDQ